VKVALVELGMVVCNSALGRLRQQNQEFNISLSFIPRFCLQKQKAKENQKYPLFEKNTYVPGPLLEMWSLMGFEQGTEMV
jgi:hypothetical protein